MRTKYKLGLLTSTSIALLLLSLLTNAQVSELGCSTNCLTCFDTTSEGCMSCENGKVLLAYQCVDTCDSLFISDGITGYTLDSEDMVCKRTMRPYDTPCAPGTFNQNVGALQIEQCLDCTSGKYCESFALTGVQSDCDAGYYCNDGSSHRSPLESLTGLGEGDICPEGSYCSAGSTQGTLCTAGYFCPDEFMTALVSTNQCQQGYYCNGGALNPTPNGPFTDYISESAQAGGAYCPVGQYCATQTSSPGSCTAGQYLPYEGAYADSECIDCTQGEYCPSGAMGATSGDCDAGYFCEEGSTSATAVRCYDDHYCPAGTLSMVPCDPGDYTFSTGSATCSDCPDGKYCRGTSTTNDCPNGYYCTDDRQFPCPTGTWMESLSGQSDISSCAICPAGTACIAVNDNLDCVAGFYCSAGAKTPRPNDDSTQNGGMCLPGTYCLTGSSVPTDCPAGYYCPNYASNVQIQCPAGYYCPTTGTSGILPASKYIICPTGYYCPAGTISPVQCEAGYYSKSQGAPQQSDCDKCPAGFSCPGGSSVPYQDIPTGSLNYCTAGYYCSSGSTTQTQTLCSRGYYCPAGTVAQLQCMKGTYQPSTGQQSCLTCPVGYYCDASDPTTASSCPKGYYCPSGTEHSNEYPCPPGTYGAFSKNEKLADCTNCDDGYYCQHSGQTSQSTKTLARYHNNGVDAQVLPSYIAGESPTPYLCPQTMWCVEGTHQAPSCPNGYWTAWRGAQSENDCITCPRGRWCRFYDMSQDATFQDWQEKVNGGWTIADLEAIETNVADAYYGTNILSGFYGYCDDGYICLEGATSSTPASISSDRGYPCPVGFYCPSGATVEIPCPPGTYNPLEQQSACATCPAGSYCADFEMTVPVTCEIGYYCVGSDIFPAPCPIGTYGTLSGQDAIGDCIACDAQQYCDTVGQPSPTDFCHAGFICLEGNSRPGPYVDVYDLALSVSGQCPEGYKCGAGDATPTWCIATTYQPTTQTDTCESCPPGTYCTGGTHSENCKAGYYCSKKSESSYPSLAQASMGGICPKQHFCALGTSQPITCPDGTIQRRLGKESCDKCPSGYTCKAGIQEKCPAYKVCVQAEAYEYPYAKTCEGGFYMTEGQLGTRTHSDCISCPEGEFCQASRIVNDCAPGYVCLEEADAHKPDIEDKAYACPLGYYCPEGTKSPILCPIGTFTNDIAAKQVSECTVCQPGKYCNYDSRIPLPCPKGAYCPMASQQPTLCPKGTYQPTVNQTGIDDCRLCLGGYVCNSRGLGNILADPETYRCPNGNYCPLGTSSSPIPCLAGTFTDESAIDSRQGTGSFTADSLNDCNFCPEHYYCERGTSYRFQYPCKDGFLCPLGSGDMIPCKAGFYCQREDNKMIQKICPQGSYCLMGSSEPRKCEPDQFCPEGSASPEQGGMTRNDCIPGEYLNINVCEPCMAGFVCDDRANQKYPIFMTKEGGAECPAGHYCPEGSTSKTAIKCPKGTQRSDTGAKTLSDCWTCPQGSASSQEASTVCIVCGSGSTNNQELSTCTCQGLFRSWQESTNTCVCMPGFYDPIPTTQESSQAYNLDCLPLLAPSCPTATSFVNEFNECVTFDFCINYYKCPKNGFFNSNLNSCFCNNVLDNPLDSCDEQCQNKALRAYFTQDNKILLEAEGRSQEYETDVFGDTVQLDGLSCPTERCLISAMPTEDGKQQSTVEALPVFVDMWKKTHPRYVSPYSRRRLSTNSTSESGQRMLQVTGADPISESIQCIKPYDSLTFQVSNANFPVYIKDSIYNTNPEFDYGAFIKLETKLTSTGLNIDTFGFTFSNEGVFVFGDYSAPDQYQTIVLVTSDENRCKGQSQWPITSNNMINLGISAKKAELKFYEEGLHVIPPLFIVFAFIVICMQQKIEARIEKKELELRIQREGGSVNMAKYFKKSADKFDKLEYLADLYKLIRENLDEINSQIAENDRRTEEESRDNMNKMLFDKHSLIHELRKGKGDTNLEDIRSGLMQMLSNLRFSDGRSLEELYKEQQIQERLKKEQAHLEEIDMKVQVDDNESDQDDKDKKSQESEESDYKKSPRKVKDDTSEVENVSDPVLYDDMIKAREQLKSKREQFFGSIDPSLSSDDKDLIMNRYDEQMQRLEREMLKEQEDQANSLKAKLAMRQKLNKQVVQVAEEDVSHTMGKIGDLHKQIEDLELEKDDMEETGINSRGMKKERELEMKVRIAEIDKEKDSRLQQMRHEYMDRIKKAKDGNEKERILEEMGERLKSTEQALEDDKKRQEANLMKLLKARQKKHLKGTVKKINKEVEDLHAQVDNLKVEVDQHKAHVYAVQGQAGQQGLISDSIAKKVNRIVTLSTSYQGEQLTFNGELNEQEQDDLEIERAQLEMQKQKELKAIDVQVEEELDTQVRRRQQERDDEKTAIKQKIAQCNNAAEQAELIELLKTTDAKIQREIEEEKRNQNVILEERRRRKADRMVIRKMRIEHDQLEDILNKELQMNDYKFKAQVEAMTETSNSLLTKEIREFLTPDQTNKEQALVMISEINDELLKRTLKMLQSKQFFDLSKHLQMLQQQIATDQMIKIKEIHARFDQLKEQAIKEMQGEQLNDELSKLQAQRILECQLINEQVTRSINEKDSTLRQKQEQNFFKERKELITNQNGVKRAQIVALMSKLPQEKQIQEVGAKLIKRIDMTQDQEIEELEKQKEERLEKAKLRIIAENEEELQLMQENLNQAMEREENLMNEQLDSRKAEIMRVKKQNLEDRLRMATGEMSHEQVKLLKDQYEQEFENLDSAIRNEKQQQMSKMRAAMLQRRIDKERKRRLIELEAEETRRREAVHRMNAGMARVFRDFVQKKQQELQVELVQNKNMGREQLKAKLHRWNQVVNFNQVERGGEEIQPWNLTKKQDEIDGMNAQQAIVAAEKKISYDVDELFLRILKVERTAERVKDFASVKEMQNIMGDINAINQSLQSRANTPAGQRMSQTHSRQ